MTEIELNNKMIEIFRNVDFYDDEKNTKWLRMSLGRYLYIKQSNSEDKEFQTTKDNFEIITKYIGNEINRLPKLNSDEEYIITGLIYHTENDKIKLEHCKHKPVFLNI